MQLTSGDSIKLANSLDEMDLNMNSGHHRENKNENYVEKILKTEVKHNNKKNLYQTVGTRVSKLREINEIDLNKDSSKKIRVLY